MRAIHRQSRPRVTAVIAHEKPTGRPAVNPRRVGGTALYSMDARRWENPGRTGDPSGLGLAFRLGLLGPGGGDDGDRAGKEKEADPGHARRRWVHRRDDPTFPEEPQDREAPLGALDGPVSPSASVDGGEAVSPGRRSISSPARSRTGWLAQASGAFRCAGIWLAVRRATCHVRPPTPWASTHRIAETASRAE